MVKITLNMPTIAAVEEPKDKLSLPFAAPLNTPIVKQILDMAYKGVVGRDGGFKITPDPEWKAHRLDKGKYTVEHKLANHKYSLSLSLLTQPGIIVLKDAGTDSFSVETLIDKEPQDLDFSFSLNMIVTSD
jgi:hypothetical protein